MRLALFAINTRRIIFAVNDLRELSGRSASTTSKAKIKRPGFSTLAGNFPHLAIGERDGE